MTYNPAWTSGGTANDGAIQVAAGEDIQSAIDDANSDMQAKIDSNDTEIKYGNAPFKTVRLETGVRYDISSTIELKPGVRLECNGSQLNATADVTVLSTHRMSHCVRPWINTDNVSGFSSTALRIGSANSGKLESNNPSVVENPYINGSPGEGNGLQFYGGGNPCSMQQVDNAFINGFNNGIHIFADGSDLSGNGNWSNGNQVFGLTMNNATHCIRLESGGAACSGNIIQGQVQTSSNTEWVVYIDDDPRDPSTTDFTDNDYTRAGNTFAVYPWDLNNVNNSYYDSSTDEKPPIIFLGRGKTYYNAFVDRSNHYGNEFIVNNGDVRPNSCGLINVTGAETRGATSFTVDARAFSPGDAQRTNYHPDGRN